MTFRMVFTVGVLPSFRAGRCAPPSAGGSRTSWRTPARAERVRDHHVAGRLHAGLRGQRELLGAHFQLAQGALASASGSPVSWAPEASASYSRERLMASWIRVAASGPRIMISSMPRMPRPLVVVRAADRDQPGEVDQEHDHGGEGSGDRRDQDVAVVDVAQLVADDTAQFALVEDAQDALGAAHRGVARVAARRERVRRLRRGDVEARHRLAGLGGELADHAVQRRGLELADRAGAHRAQGQLVAVPVRVRVRAQRDEDEHREGEVKAHTLREGAPVALAIVDPDDPYRYVQVRGRVRRVTEEGAAQHIDLLAKKYLGQDKYTLGRPGEVRLLCEIEPTSSSGMG